MNWTKRKDTNTNHTGGTLNECDGFRIWKGKYRVYSTIYSANEWHLERLSDRMIVYSANTAKECKENFEYRKDWLND